MATKHPTHNYSVQAYVQPQNGHLVGLMGVTSPKLRNTPLNKIIIPMDTSASPIVSQNVEEWWRHRDTVHGKLQSVDMKRYTATQRKQNWFPATPMNDSYKLNIWQRNLMNSVTNYAVRLSEIVQGRYHGQHIDNFVSIDQLLFFGVYTKHQPPQEAKNIFDPEYAIAHLQFEKQFPDELYKGVPVKGSTKEKSGRKGKGGTSKELSR